MDDMETRRAGINAECLARADGTAKLPERQTPGQRRLEPSPFSEPGDSKCEAAVHFEPHIAATWRTRRAAERARSARRVLRRHPIPRAARPCVRIIAGLEVFPFAARVGPGNLPR